MALSVIKFGGTSVGTAEALTHVKKIVERHGRPTLVVVSALSGVTDTLLQLSQAAARGEEGINGRVDALAERHHRLIADVIAPARRGALMAGTDALIAELRSILHGISLIHDLTPKTEDAVVAYGERISSLIVAALLDGARHIDARTLIKTTRKAGRRVVDFKQSNSLIVSHLKSLDTVAVMGGFIAADRDTGITTNLGRGGSDYTASILSAALDAERLEIWTDVDGFMTADPRIIPNAFTIDRLSYAEAMELCNFGAKVIYPPTIYPVCRKHIPIYVRNTFRPDHPGSIISDHTAPGERPIRGISSVADTCMVTVSGPSMVGVIGVNRRIFTTLAQGGISVFMVAQNSSETSTSICVVPADAERTCRLLDTEFAEEIADGAMNPASLLADMASVAVVGERMRKRVGIAGQLFSVLGRNGISISAVAMGGKELNLSFVVEKSQLRKTLNVLHDSLFLSEHEDLNLFICGTGTVGGSLIAQIAAQREKLLRERGLKLNIVGVSGRSHAAYSREGIDPLHYREAMQQGGTGGMERMMREIEEMNIFNSVFVDCTASPEVAQYYLPLLKRNVHVVAANKIAASSAYDNYRELKETAREKGVKFLFETNVGAGLPIINTINDLRSSGDRVLRIEAVLSGTLNYVFNTLSADIPLSRAVRMAQENGYSEPDPRVDLSGQDVVRKLVILARESGYRLETADVESRRFIPEELFQGSLERFWQELPRLDAHFESERRGLEKAHRRWRFVAEWEDGHATVGLKEIALGHPLYDLDGSNNILLLTTERYHDYPMLIQGYGAGADVTAAGVFADIMRIG